MMRISIAILGCFVLAAVQNGWAQGRTDQCISCHATLDDTPSRLFANDIHYRRGISCAACHGGNPHKEDMAEAMSPEEGFVGVPRGDGITAACSSCHGDAERMKGFGSSLPTDQASMIRESVHGMQSVRAGESIVHCATCHGAHGIRRVKDRLSPVHPLQVTGLCSRCHGDPSYMRMYNLTLPVDQLEKYRTSVHGKLNAKGDAKAAECVSCHGSHDIRRAGDIRSRVYPTNLPGTCASCHSNAEYMNAYKIPTDQFEKYVQSVHGIALLEKGDPSAPACNDCHDNHGAVPPGISSISKVCGTCHALNADLFAKSPHKEAFERRGLPECETCHGNHAVAAATEELLGVDEGAACGGCHAKNEKGRGYAAALAMRANVDSLDRQMEQASEALDDAEQKGMEVTEAVFKMRDARQARFEARTMVHAFDSDQHQQVIEKGLSAAAFVLTESHRLIEDYFYRRWGLGISTLIITVVALSLYLYIRRIEKRKKSF